MTKRFSRIEISFRNRLDGFGSRALKDCRSTPWDFARRLIATLGRLAAPSACLRCSSSPEINFVCSLPCNIILYDRRDSSASVLPMNISFEKFPEDTGKLPELSIVMPCLNEADALAICISTGARALTEQDIAAKLNARLANVRERGYGSALMGGIAAARGKFIAMGDADDSYDYRDVRSRRHGI
jgi:hypothetical protein